ncbi:MAG: PAS domain-containing protein [Rhodothermaceae bacterium]
MATLLLYGFGSKIKIRESISGYLRAQYPDINIKYAESKKSCLKLIEENLVSCIIINQIEDDSDLFGLLKSIETNPGYSHIPLIGVNSSGKDLNLNITDSFIATLFIPLNFDELRSLLENNIKGLEKHRDVKTKKDSDFRFKEKYDTRKSCFARCKAVKNKDKKVIDYKFIEINPEFAEFLDLMIEEIYNSSLLQIFPGLANILLELLNSANENGKPVYYECFSEANNKHFEVIAYKEDTEIVNTIIIDTTQKHEEEEELFRQKEKFGERVKELRCLYNITRVLSENHISIKEMLKKIIILIPWAFKYPALAKVKITVGDEVETSAEYEETEWKIEENLIIREKRVGKVSVVYKEEKPKEYIGPFLKDEISLLRSVCEQLAGSIEKFETRSDLLKMNQQLDLAFQAADFGIWDWDISDNRLFIDNKYLEILGENIVTNSLNKVDWLERLHPEDKEQILQKMDDNLAGHNSMFLQEFRIKTKSGNWKWLQDTGKITRRDDMGKPVWMTGMVRDIDDEKKNRIELENRLQFEKMLIDFIKFYSGLRDDRFEEGINKIISDFSKFLGSVSSELVFYENEKNDLKIKEVVKPNYNGSNSSLNFSKQSNSVIYSALGKNKTFVVPDNCITEKQQKKLLKEANSEMLLFIPLIDKQKVTGYNLHYFDDAEKEISPIDYNLIEIYSDLLSGMLQQMNLAKSISGNYQDTGSLLMKFFPGLIHEINSPSQYIADNLDFIKENTVDYIEALKNIKELVSDENSSDLSKIKEILADRVNRKKIAKVTGEIGESFNHIEAGLENIQDIIKSINEFVSDEDFKNHIEINKMLKTVIGFTRNEWKYHCDINYSADSEVIMMFTEKGNLYKAFVYLLVNTIYLMKRNELAANKKKTININTKTNSGKARIEVEFSNPEFSTKKIIEIFNRDIEVKTDGWTLAEKFEFCRYVFTENLSGEFFMESNPKKQFKFVVVLPIEIQENYEAGSDIC